MERVSEGGLRQGSSVRVRNLEKVLGVRSQFEVRRPLAFPLSFPLTPAEHLQADCKEPRPPDTWTPQVTETPARRGGETLPKTQLSKTTHQAKPNQAKTKQKETPELPAAPNLLPTLSIRMHLPFAGHGNELCDYINWSHIC